METKGLVTREGCEGDKRGNVRGADGPRGLATIGTGGPVPCRQRSASTSSISSSPRSSRALTEAYLPVLEKLRRHQGTATRTGSEQDGHELADLGETRAAR